MGLSECAQHIKDIHTYITYTTKNSFNHITSTLIHDNNTVMLQRIIFVVSDVSSVYAILISLYRTVVIVIACFIPFDCFILATSNGRAFVRFQIIIHSNMSFLGFVEVVFRI